ncbi:MAG: polysaccharide biosynthesis tyrosine autokinase [Marinobacterium sp.]|nr:polysaccharide biosynthesis tyrosine autokinase [Marinobacterium sp.]
MSKLQEAMPGQAAVAEVDLAALWHAIESRKYILVFVAVLVMTASSFAVSRIVPMYKATSTILIEKQQGQVVSIEQVYSFDGNDKEYLQTQFEMLKSRSLAERVVQTLNLTKHPAFDVRVKKKKSFLSSLPFSNIIKQYIPIPEEKVVTYTEEQVKSIVIGKLVSSIDISPINKTRLAKVSVASSDPAIAAEIANIIADVFIESQLEAKVDMNKIATGWINSQLDVLKEKLETSERNLQLYREQENLLDWNGVVTMKGDELKRILTRQSEARRDRVAAEGKYWQVKEIQSNDWEAFLDLPDIRLNNLIGKLKEVEVQAKIRFDEAVKRYGPKHPQYMASQSALDSARRTLASQVHLLVSGIKRDYELALAAEKSLDKLLAENNQTIHKIKQKEFKLIELQREVNTNAALYDTFLTRLKEATVTSDLEDVNIRVVDKAVIPGVPFKPKKTLMVLISGIGAVIFCSLLFVFLELKKNVIKTPDDVEGKLGLPLLGAVPALDAKKVSCDMNAAFTNEELPTFSEAIRTVRTSLLLSDIEKDNKRVLISSSCSGEGKSTLSFNLAIALGKMEKVVLVCADMRKKYVVSGLGEVEGHLGLSALIQDQARLSDVLVSHEGIDVIYPGEMPANPLELLSTERFERILDYLSSRYDRIIIDSSPTELVSDALVLSTSVNSVVYVVKADDTTVPMVRRGINRLISNNASVLGIVLNKVAAKGRGRFGYGKAIDEYGYGGY